ncbi:L,D-transpeptidase family protein [Thiohalocapsa marina]|nr:L,D-transpeptidase family protein [Thiohalocapsa marina]
MLCVALILPGGCAQRQYQGRPAAAVTDASVADSRSIPEPQEDPPEPGQLYDWSGHGRAISHIVIDTNEQKARFYDGVEQVGWTTIASGVARHATPRGEFAILEKVSKKRSNLYGKIVDSNGKVVKHSASNRDPVPEGGRFIGASMPHFMRMTYDGIGMHAGPIPRPGYPASHGCIRMPKTVAEAVFNHASTGTRVTVVGNGPDYGNYAERIARQRATAKTRSNGNTAASTSSRSSGTTAGGQQRTAASSSAPAPTPASTPVPVAAPATADTGATPTPRSVAAPEQRADWDQDQDQNQDQAQPREGVRATTDPAADLAGSGNDSNDAPGYILLPARVVGTEDSAQHDGPAPTDAKTRTGVEAAR